MEEALYDSAAMRSFVGIDLGFEGAPDETTVCKFRTLLERNKLGKVLLTAANDPLRRRGIKITKETIVDATIIGTPSSCTRSWILLRARTIATRCPTCCMATKRGFGATRPIKAKPQSFTK